MNSEGNPFSRAGKSVKREIVFHGIPASPGIAFGTVRLYLPDQEQIQLKMKTQLLEENEIPQEIQLFRQVLEEVRQEISGVRNSLTSHGVKIFDAHLLLLQDRVLIDEVIKKISAEKLSASSAFSQVLQKYVTAMSAVNDAYLRERTADLQDVGGRVLSRLLGVEKNSLDHLPEKCILVARDLTPSDTAQLDRQKVLGITTEAGSRTSHTAILSRSLRIPAIVGMNHFVEQVEDGDQLIIDGFLGLVVLNPVPETVALYREKEKNNEKLYQELLQETRLQPETRDGYRIILSANIESPSNIPDIKTSGAAGVGLFRTEYLYMNQNALPAEDSQFEAYKAVAEACGSDPVIIRTLDLGGDKLAEYIHHDPEQNPFLGLRAVRFCLRNPEIFKTQLRAILRAGCFGNIKIMFPMICSLEELTKCLEMVEKAKTELEQKKIPYQKHMEIGIMVEIPSSAVASDALAEVADFFSIGTNDLLQYSLAVDRNNEHVASLYQPSNPSLWNLIAGTAASAEKHHKWVGVCGELGGDPRYVPVLLGLGVKELSMSPSCLGHVRRLIRSITMADAELLAKKVLASRTAEEVSSLVNSFLEQNAPGILKDLKNF